MSKELPDLESARETVAQRVHMVAYLNKVASLNPKYIARNEQEVRDLLQLGFDLEQASFEAQTKQAETTGNPYAVALSALHGVLDEQGLGAGRKQAAAQDAELRYWQIGQKLASDPELYAAAVAIKAAEAEASNATA